MIISTAPDVKEYLSGSHIRCFLAGGITGCDDWQSQVIEILASYEKEGFDLDKLVIFNPRQSNFDINDKSATEKQIAWEYDRLSHCDIFSMYFTNQGIQPICLYELGKYGETTRMKYRDDTINSHMIVSVEEDYIRKEDIRYQLKNSFNYSLKINFKADPKYHAIRIIEAYNQLKNYSA